MDDIKFFIKNLQTQNELDLYQELSNFKKELFNLRFQQAIGDLKNTSKFKFAKKNVARIKTELSKRLKKLGE